MELQRGTQIDRYVVDGRIGSGGMAHVYRVRHARLGSVHAIKLLQVPTPSVIERLLREGRAQSSLRHPHIVPVTDVIDVLGAPGLVMEWIDGPSLAQLLEGGRLALPEVVAVAQGLFSGIRAAHGAGWVHRDLKPGNVLLQPIDDGLVPRVTDFGLVKALTPTSGDDHATRTGAMMGTPAYMAPEQFVDAASVDHRADVYALGVLLYQLCAGRRPYDARDTWSLLEQVRAASPPTVGSLRDGLPTGLDELLHAAMHPVPDERLPTATAFASAWDALDWPAPRWTPDTLERAAERRLPEAHALVREPTDDSFRTLSATFDSLPDPSAPASEPLSAPTVLPTAPPAPLASPAPRRAHRWPWALGAAAVVAAAAWLLTTTPGAPDEATTEAFTATTAPRISDAPLVQGHLDRAWQATLQGSYPEALRAAEAAQEGAPDDPAPRLLRTFVLMRNGQVRRSLDLSDHLVAQWPDAPGPIGSLVRVVSAQKDTQRIDVPELADHLAAYPDDALGRLMAADYCSNEGDAFCATHIGRLLALLPHTPIAYHVAAGSWAEVNDMARAREVVRAGLAVSPDDPVLLRLRAQDELHRGVYDDARATLRRLAEVDPSDIAQKHLRVRLAVLSGDDAALDGLRAELTSPSQELPVAQGYYAAAAATLIGLGRTHEAEALLRASLAAARERGSPSNVFDTLLSLRGAAFQRGDLEGSMAYIHEASAFATANPEILRRDRDRLTAFLLHVKAVDALRAGQLEEAETLLERLRRTPQGTVMLTEPIERAIAIERRQPDRVAELDKSLWYGECTRKVELGDALLRAGAPERAVPLLREGAPRCVRSTDQRAVAVRGYVALAEAHLALGHHEKARQARQEAESLWPDPDEDHRVRARLVAIAARIDE